VSADPIAKLLIVDDEAAQMKALHDTLEIEGYCALGFTSAGAALAAIREQSFDLVLTDLMMPEMDGVAFLRAAFEIDPTLAGIVMTGQGTLDTAVQAMQAGALDYILKPFKLSAVLPVLARSLAVRRVRMENIELRQAVGMYELSKAVGLALDFETVLREVADTAIKQSGVRAVSVLLTAGKDSNELYVAAARGENAEAVRGTRIGFSAALSEWLARSRETDQFDGVSSAQAAPLSGITGNVSAAMMAGGAFVGILHFNFEHPLRPVAPGRVKALNILAGAAASALEAASLLEKVRAADRQYRRLTENAADIIFRYDLYPAPRLAYVNQAIAPTTGYFPQEYYADADLALRIVHPDDRALMEQILRGEYANGSTAGIRCVHRTGNVVWIEQRAMHVWDQDGRLVAIEAIARDVTTRKQLEERLDEGILELRRSLIEKTALLQEVHHRVKNNLQVICSLLSMQISCAGNESSGPLNDARSRVLSMSLIHEQIYQSETLVDLNFGAYIEALASRLFGAYCVNPSHIRLELSVEPISLGLDQAIPCGLILNELLSNSLKHAFGDGREGVIRISLRQCESGYVELAVADNGVGLPVDFNLEHSRTLGLQVVGTLIRQLGADLRVKGEGGATFTFGWKLPEVENPAVPPREFSRGAQVVIGRPLRVIRQRSDLSDVQKPGEMGIGCLVSPGEGIS
jgi:PAS domain S-box-containing protein